MTPIPVTHHARKREGEGWWCSTTSANGRPSPACTGTAPSSARASRERGGVVFDLPWPAFLTHAHTRRGRGRRRRGRRRPLDAARPFPHLGCRLNPSQREREAAKAGESWVQGCGTLTPVAVATSTVIHAGRRRAKTAEERSSTGTAEGGGKPNRIEPSKSNPKTGPLAWIRGGFPHPPIYG